MGNEFQLTAFPVISESGFIQLFYSIKLFTFQRRNFDFLGSLGPLLNIESIEDGYGIVENMNGS